MPCVKYNGQWSNGTCMERGSWYTTLKKHRIMMVNGKKIKKMAKGIMYYDNGDVYEGE